MNSKFLLTVGLLTSLSTTASQMIYVPVNPSFGGSPLNGSFLLSTAQAQNDIEDPDLDDEEKSPLEEFNDRLQRALLSRLSSSLSASFVDEDGDLVPGTTETSDFVIEIVDLGNGTLSITTTDKVSGAATTFTVDSAI